MMRFTLIPLVLLCAACGAKQTRPRIDVAPPIEIPQRPFVPELTPAMKRLCPELPPLKDKKIKTLIDSDAETVKQYNTCRMKYSDLLDLYETIREKVNSEPPLEVPKVKR